LAVYLWCLGIWAMTAALVATIAATQVITGRKHHQPVIQIVVLVFNERDHLAFAAAIPHHSKDEHCAGAARSSRRAKAALEILAVEKIVHITKEAQRT